MNMREIPPEQSLIEYPSSFPIKVMGQNLDGFVEAVVAIAQQFDPCFDLATVERRPSKGNNYLGVTITVTATSREQLDELYRTLCRIQWSRWCSDHTAGSHSGPRGVWAHPRCDARIHWAAQCRHAR